MIHGLIMKKIVGWVSLPILPLLGTFALLWLYLTEDRDDFRNHPYSF
jgi:hypothetical protein